MIHSIDYVKIIHSSCFENNTVVHNLCMIVCLPITDNFRMCKLFTLLALSTVFLDFINCAKVLGVFPSPGYSQFILGEVLMTELARRGHNVTVISAYKPRENFVNYKTVLVDGMVNRPQRTYLNFIHVLIYF